MFGAVVTGVSERLCEPCSAKLSVGGQKYKRRLWGGPKTTLSFRDFPVLTQRPGHSHSCHPARPQARLRKEKACGWRAGEGTQLPLSSSSGLAPTDPRAPASVRDNTPGVWLPGAHLGLAPRSPLGIARGMDHPHGRPRSLRLQVSEGQSISGWTLTLIINQLIT